MFSHMAGQPISSLVEKKNEPTLSLDDWQDDIDLADIDEELLQKDLEHYVTVTYPDEIEFSEESTFTDDFKKLILQLQISLMQNVSVIDQLSKLDPKLLNQHLEEHFGPHSSASFEFISKLTRNLSFINHQLLRPDPKPLPEIEKDETAYLTLREKLTKNTSLQSLLDNVWKLSSFLNIGKNFGIQKQLEHKDDIQFSAVTLNGAWLREYLGGLIQLNGSFLTHNMERAQAAMKLFHDIMEHLTSLDFIFFQEAFDKKIRDFLTAEFEKLGYNTFGKDGQKSFNFGSGLLGFSRFPIVDHIFVPYRNGEKRLGEETCANKGVAGAKVLVENKFLMSLFMTHETAGGGILPWDAKFIGTTSELRGKQQQDIHNLIKEWGQKPIINPETQQPYPTIATVFAGDNNTTNNEIYQLLALSTGNSFNARETGDIKYAGPFNNLLGFLAALPKECWPIPRNFLNTRLQKEAKVEGGKPVSEALEEKAKQEGLATGSTYTVKDLKHNKNGLKQLTTHDTEHRVIDLLIAKPEAGAIKAFESYIVGTTMKSAEHPFVEKAFSDHLLLFAVMIFTRPSLPALPTLKDKLSLTTFGSTKNDAPEVQTEIQADQENMLQFNLGS